MPSPVTLGNLVEQYKAVLAQQTEDGSGETRLQLEDVTYALCVSTGTLTPEAALIAAERLLTAALIDLSNGCIRLPA